MALGDLFQIGKAGLQSALIVSSLCIIVPMAISVADFNGHCPLFSRAHWSANATGPYDHHFLVVNEWGLQSHCTFGVFIGCAQLLVSLFYAFFIGVHLYLQREAYGCEQAQFGDVLSNYPDINSGRFLFTFGAAKIGLWFSFLVWFLDLLLMLLQLLRLHRRERLLVSLRREARMLRNRLHRDPDYVNI
uniref:Transmembrane protein 179 n=1 Tax=Macrostomum lignano TaxID=282301 RepID=A0A1I8IDK0_9PLAT